MKLNLFDIGIKFKPNLISYPNCDDDNKIEIDNFLLIRYRRFLWYSS